MISPERRPPWGPTTSGTTPAASSAAKSSRPSDSRRVRSTRGAPVGSRLTSSVAAVISEADIQEDIEFALIQMKAETLNKINDALVRLEQGDYGNCYDCGEEIAEKRLRALPFAVRCKDCEEARENAEQRQRQLAARRGTSSLFLDM